MIFKELETKQLFDNSYGNSVWIDRYVYYNGTEQISIYIKKGYGADERVINVVISEHKLDQWIADFKNLVNLPKTKNMNSENEKSENSFNSMREILFDSMKEVKNGNLDVEKAKAIASISQIVINSVKVEIEFLKLTGSDKKPKMID